MSEWKQGNVLPSESGYYFTIYYNADYKAEMRKAFWFDVKSETWIFRFKPEVKMWWNVKHDYYIPCQTQKVDSPNDIHFSDCDMHHSLSSS